MEQDAKFVPPDTPFKSKEAVNAIISPTANALDFFKLYLTDAIESLMVAETNRYADQYIRGNILKPHSPVQNWVPTTKDEMLAFIGLSILMGVVYKPRLHMYWSTDELFQSDIFPNVMSRDHYLLLLHFANDTANNINDPDRDRLYKIRQLIDMIHQQCRYVYSPARDLCVDKSLLLFKNDLVSSSLLRPRELNLDKSSLSSAQKR